MPEAQIDPTRRTFAPLPSSSSREVTPHRRLLADRLGKLEYSEAEMDQVMRANNDSVTFDAWLVQRELSAREHENLHNHLQSYLQEVRRKQIFMRSTSGAGPANVEHQGFWDG